MNLGESLAGFTGTPKASRSRIAGTGMPKASSGRIRNSDRLNIFRKSLNRISRCQSRCRRLIFGRLLQFQKTFPHKQGLIHADLHLETSLRRKAVLRLSILMTVDLDSTHMTSQSLS